MEDPNYAWPSWKFGLKHDDLFGKLHDDYNTCTFTIQDTDAFYHDVAEISYDADTIQELHKRLADRRLQRLQELNDALEGTAVEIICQPQLMDSEHWPLALQLFRTKSYDSIVRYFSSFLPANDPSRRDPPTASSSFSEAHSEHTAHTAASSVDRAPTPPFLENFDKPDGPVMTEEPDSFDDNVDDLSAVGAPLSPTESEPFAVQPSVSSPGDLESRDSTNPPSRSMSFSGSESGAFVTDFIRRTLGHDEVEYLSQSEESDAAVISLTDGAESYASLDSADHDQPLTPIRDDEDDYLPSEQFPEDDFDALDALHDTPESELATPKQETVASSYMKYKSVTSRRLPSPHRRPPSPKSFRQDGHPLMVSRRSPEESMSKIQKCVPDAIRQRPRARRRGMV